MNSIVKPILLLAIFVTFGLSAKGQIGSRYIIAPGDTTVIVNKVNQGLNTPENKFLRRDSKYADMNVYLDTSTKYHSLEEAAYVTSDLLNKVEKGLLEIKAPNTSLSFAISNHLVKHRVEELEAKAIADSLRMANAELNKQEMVELFYEYGDRPTFYINGAPVPESYTLLLRPNEVLSRSIKTNTTLSGNPNGEIWIEVPPSVAYKLGIDDTYYWDEQVMESAEDDDYYEEEIVLKNRPSTTKHKKTARPR